MPIFGLFKVFIYLFLFADSPNSSQSIIRGTVLRWRKARILIGYVTGKYPVKKHTNPEGDSHPFIHTGGYSSLVRLEPVQQRYVACRKANRLSD